MTNTHTIGDAIAITTTWIANSDLPFSAAFIGGSVAHADDDAPYDPASDVDCYLVVSGDPPDGKIGKITVEGVLLDVSWIPWSVLEHAESDAVLASLLNFGRVVKDDGRLGPLQNTVRRNFTNVDAVSERVESMRAKIRSGLAADSSHLSPPEQVMNWLFPATLATHIALVASCSPLTVRKRFLAARKVVVFPPDAYDTLLQLFGFDTVTRQEAQQWLNNTARLFDATTDIAKTSSRFWASDIVAGSRPIAIDASQRLIDDGDYREALFWIVATSSRCLVVRNDAGVSSIDFEWEYWQMLRDLGIATAEARRHRADAILHWI